MAWRKLSSVTKYRNRYMSVTDDVVVTSEGDQVTFGIVHKEPAVMIIPWDGAKFTLVKQYRYPVDYTGWEFPAGHYEHSSVEAAVRAELAEEAGLVAGRLTPVGQFHVAPGHNTQVCYVYLATDLTPGSRHLEPAERGMTVGAFTKSALDQLIRDGEIEDGLTLSALKLLELSQHLSH